MSQGGPGVTFRHWLAVCLLIVWPLNLYYFTEKKLPLGSDSLRVHGAPVGAIIAILVGARHWLRACRQCRRAGPAAGPSFGRVMWRHGWWCLPLLPLLVRFHWTSSLSRIDSSVGSAGPSHTSTTIWGWGGPGSGLFAVAAAFALLGLVWRQACEAAATER